MSSQYQSEIKMKQLYGAYALCSQRHEQRYYLNTLVPEDKSSYMVKLNIKINKIRGRHRDSRNINRHH